MVIEKRQPIHSVAAEWLPLFSIEVEESLLSLWKAFFNA
jgi:hypothetical protein